MKQLKNRLAAVLEENNISPYLLAKMIGKPQSTVSRVLNNETKPQSATISAIAKALNLKESWLLTGQGEKYAKDSPETIPKMDTLAERMEYVREQKHLSYQKLGDMIGSKESALRHAITNNNVRDVYAIAMSAALGVNLEWLKTGKGEIYNTLNNPIGKPFYDVDFDGEFTESLDEIDPTSTVYLPGIKDVDLWVKTGSRAMEPRIYQNSIIGLKRIDESEWKELILFGAIYVVETKGIRFLRHVHEGKTPETISLVPENDDMPKQELPKKMIQGLYKVTAMGGAVANG
jgi:transcriptional regulator with XRE-family HTH domain